VAEKALDTEAVFGLGLLEHDDAVDEGDQESSAEICGEMEKIIPLG
jgi:hypothetical protein